MERKTVVVDADHLNVAMVTPQWSNTKGGPTTYVQSLRQALVHRGHAVEVLTTERAEGATTFSGGLVNGSLDLYRHLARLRPDVVHIHGRLQSVLSARLYKRLRHPCTRVVFTFHTAPYVRPFLPSLAGTRKPDYSGGGRFFARALLGTCDAVTSVSKSILADLALHLGIVLPRAAVVPSASGPQTVDLAKAAEMRRLYGLEGAQPLLGTMGVMSWDWKVLGHQICVDALQIIGREKPAARLAIAGDGAHRAYLERHVEEAGLRSRVNFLGNIDCVSEFLSTCDLYVHMALNEGCPLAVIEAMWAGKPIVAAARGGIPEIIRDQETGLLVEPDPCSLAEAVLSLLRDPGAASGLGSAARSYAAAHLNWDSVAQQYLQVYRGGP